LKIIFYSKNIVDKQYKSVIIYSINVGGIMEKLIEFVNENRIKVLLCWIIIICLLTIFVNEIFLSTRVTIIEMLCIAATSACTYIIIVVTMSFINAKEKMKWLRTIFDEFPDMQISMEDNQILIEIPEANYETLQKYADVQNISLETISNHNGIVKAVL